MDAQKLINAVGATMVSGRAILHAGGKNMIIARVIDNKVVLNDNGLALASEIEAAQEAAKAKAKAVKPKAPEPKE